MKSQNTIEFNGQHYDATSGKPLKASKESASPSIDGVYGAHQAVTSLAKPAPLSDVKPQPARPQHALRPQPSPVKPHQPQTATTLMRRSVKRPQASLKAQAAVQGSLQHATPNLITTKQSAYSLDHDRLARARQTEQSPSISRHYDGQDEIPMTFAPLTVQPMPVKPEADEPVAAPEPVARPSDMFEQAINNATSYVDVKSHHAKLKKHRRSHLASLTAGGMALLAIAGFATYQHSPSMQFKVASLNAGLSTHMPNFKAAGFAYNGAKGSKGTLTVGFTGKDANYQLVQKQTNLSGDDMIGSVGSVDASGNSDYSTLQAGNTTVYRFSNNEATWVANGSWYSVSGDSALSDNQVTSLVNNL